MNTTKTVKQRRRQSPEEMRAAFKQMVEYAQTLQRLKELSGIPEADRHRYHVQFFDPNVVTSKDVLNWYNQKVRTLRPRKRRGRPKKEPSAEPLLPKQDSRALPPALTDLAFTMDDRGAHWSDIAKACYPDKKPAELRTNAMRKHVARLIENGAIRSRRRQKTRTE